jgi:hypothetical protein
VHDGQAEPGPVLAACGESQERSRPLLRCHPRAVVGDGHDHRVLSAAGPHVDHAAVVADRIDRVVEQVVEDLLQVPDAERHPEAGRPRAWGSGARDRSRGRGLASALAVASRPSTSRDSRAISS